MQLTNALALAKQNRSLKNGSFVESFDALVTSDGATITLTIEQSGGGNLICIFSSGNYLLVCSPACTIELTAGSATVPQKNFIYILETAPTTLVKSTTQWPTSEHIKVGYFYVSTPTIVQSDAGALINQNWNDHFKSPDEMGHLTHISRWIREQPARYKSGIDGAGDASTYIVTTVGPSRVSFKCGAGAVSQLHLHNFSAKDTTIAGGDDIHILNHLTTPFTSVSDLLDITEDALGSTIGVNKYYSLIFAGVANKSGQYSPLLVNLPTGVYSSLSDAEADISGYDVLTLPDEFVRESGTGFLICRITFKRTVSTWQYQSVVDLRGSFPSKVSGGASGGTIVDFNDSLFSIFNNADNTKIVEVDASIITTGNTRTITVPDEDVTLSNAETVETTGALINSATEKIIPVDADFVGLMDSGASNILKKVSWASLRELFSQKSLVINGNMEVDRRNNGSKSPAGGNLCDMFQFGIAGSGTMAYSQSTGLSTPSDKSNKTLKLTVTAADTSITSAEVYNLQYRMEGRDYMPLHNGQDITIRFVVYATVTGTYCLFLRNGGAANRRYIREYTVNVSNTWQEIIITIPTDTSGVWDFTTGTGLAVSWSIAAGSDYYVTADTWINSSLAQCTSNQVNAMATIGNIFEIAEFDIVRGSDYKGFHPELYPDTWARCQRYCQLFTSPHMVGVCGIATFQRVGMTLPVTMRIAPIVTVTGAFNFFDGGVVAPYISTTNNYHTVDTIELAGTCGAGLQGKAACIKYSGQADVWLCEAGL